MLNRRTSAVRVLQIAAMVPLLTRCAMPSSGGTNTGTSPGGTTGIIPVPTLAQVKAEVQAVANAVQESNNLIQADPQASPAAKKASAAATAAVNAAAAAVLSFSGSATSTTIADIVTGFLNAASQAMPVILTVLNANPATAVAISLGIAIVQAFAGNLSMPITTANINGQVTRPMAAQMGAPVPIPRPRLARRR